MELVFWVMVTFCSNNEVVAPVVFNSIEQIPAAVVATKEGCGVEVYKATMEKVKLPAEVEEKGEYK